MRLYLCVNLCVNQLVVDDPPSFSPEVNDISQISTASGLEREMQRRQDMMEEEEDELIGMLADHFSGHRLLHHFVYHFVYQAVPLS